MVLAVDVGNTNICLGLFKDDELIKTFRLATDLKRTSDQYAAEFSQIIGLASCDGEKLDGSVIGSVVPSLNAVLVRALELISNERPLVLEPGVKTGLNIKIDDPGSLGADLAAGAVGAIQKYAMPCLIVDLGTATKITVLDKTGAFRGGAISPGVGTSLDALKSRTAQLPGIPLKAPKSPIGTNTVECMQSGTVLGWASMIDGMVDRIQSSLGEKAKTIVATGGLAKDIMPCCSFDYIYDPDLILRGLKTVYDKNKKS